MEEDRAPAATENRRLSLAGFRAAGPGNTLLRARLFMKSAPRGYYAPWRLHAVGGGVGSRTHNSPSPEKSNLTTTYQGYGYG